MSITTAPFGGYATPSGLTLTDAARVQTLLTQLLNVIPDNTADPAIATTYAPDFDNMPPAAAARIRTEIQAIKDAITGAPTNTAAT
jgi:hypothetical protein